MSLVIANNSMKLQPEFQPVVEELSTMVKHGLKDSIHSLYIYGSVANGVAVPNQSNLDVILVVSHGSSNNFATFLNTLKWRLTNRYPIITSVSIKVTTVSEVLSLESIFTWGFTLRQCSTCLLGDDLTECFGDFEPSWEIAKHWNWDIETFIPEYRTKLAHAKTKEVQLSLQKVLAKKLLRASYSLIMHKKRLWIDSPIECGKTFLKYHPDKIKEIQRLVIMLGDSTIPKRSVVGLLDDYGSWLIKSYKKTEFRIG